MIKTLRLSFSLKNTYRVNGILYSIKQIPLLKRLIPDTVYQIRGLKVFANVLSAIWEIISAFFGKLLYFLVMLVGASGLYEAPGETKAQLLLHILLFLSVIGSFTNTYLFNPTKDKYYAMILLGMDARKYTLVNYFYAIFKVLIGFTLFGFFFGLLMGLSGWECLLIPFFVAGLKLSAAAYELWRYERKGAVNNENKLSAFFFLAIVLLLAAAYGLPAFGVMLPRPASAILMCLPVALGFLSVHKICSFQSYRAMYQELLSGVITQMDPNARTTLQKEQSHKNISADIGITSGKKGFEYLNELFIRRHQKILWGPARKIAAVAGILIAAVLLLFYLKPEAKGVVNGMLMTFLPYFVFVMYLINRGTGFTRALFVNCDHSLLTYSFYKQPKLLLKLFQIRLREIIKINLLPAAVIGGGLVVLLFASGGTDNPLNYAVLFVSIVCLSIFFSVHYLTLYYLLQPYNAGTELKSGTYQLLMGATYLVCYAMLQLEMPTPVFGMMTIVFCILYCIVASVLVYKFAPKTFKIRN